jgi:hypothetical protein
VRNHKTRQPIVIAGEPVDTTLYRDRAAAVQRMVRRLRRELGPYRELPPELIQNDITAISTLAVQAYVRWLSDNHDVSSLGESPEMTVAHCDK